jgi:cytochrome c oxidase subunit 3
MEAAINPENAGPSKIASGKILLWIAIASIVMLFAGLTSGFIVRKEEGNWLNYEFPAAFYVSTVLMLLSSITMHLAVLSAKKNKLANLKRYIIATLALGITFVFSQFIGWSNLVSQGVYFVGNPAGSFMYVLTGLHMAHLLEKYSSTNYLGVSLCAIYWHFLDGLWIYLFVFLALNH